MRFLRQLAACLILAAAALTPLDAVHAQHSVSGNLYYRDCVTPIGTGAGNLDYVYVQAYAYDGAKLISVGSAANCKGSYTVAIGSLASCDSKAVYLYFYFNNSGSKTTPDRWVGFLDVMEKNQTIDIGMSEAPPGVPGIPTTPTTITGKCYTASGTTVISGPNYLPYNIFVYNTSGITTTVPPPPAPSQSYLNLNSAIYSTASPAIPIPGTADKTLSLIYEFGGSAMTLGSIGIPLPPGSSALAPYTMSGVVGGTSAGRSQIIDMVFKPAPSQIKPPPANFCPTAPCPPRQSCLRGRPGIFRR